jgi:FAD/FMN-containing dehydrogenase
LIRAPLALRESRTADADGDHGLKRLHQRLKAAFDPREILNPGLDLFT